MRLKKNHHNFFFHPFEIAICGFSNTGKTTLISKLIKELTKNFKVGYVKHDAHKFQMDIPGKDTYVAREAGAVETLINDEGRYGLLSDRELDQAQTSNLMRDNDVLIVEGHKYSKIPKIVILGQGEVKAQTLSEINEGKINNILAIINTDQKEKTSELSQYPQFDRDDLDKIKSFILEYYSELIPKKLYGLVLTGGKSQRMNKDKGGLKYYDTDQVTHTKNMLAPHCDEVFISCRSEQKEKEFISSHKQIHDSFPSSGPSSGILSAMHAHPDAAWIITACDLPYLTQETINELIESRNPYKTATCFLNPLRGWPEPLCTIYEPKAMHKLIEYFGAGKPCPRKVLFNSEINALELSNKEDLNNVNTPDDLLKAQNYINEANNSGGTL